MPRIPSLAILLALIFAHMGLAAWYASVTPYRTPGVVMISNSDVKDVGAPDERQHVNYVARLARGGGFPFLNEPGADGYENYQAHQPPAFYVVGAFWSRITGATDLESRSGGLRLRWLNVVIGATTVAGAFFLGLWGFRKSEVGLLAAAFVAFLPMNAALSGAVSNDPLLFSLCTWTLALCVKALRDGWSWSLALGVGALTGLALLTKTTALGLLPVLLAAALLKQKKRPSPAMVATTLALTLAIVGPWWVRNAQVYPGDPLAMKAFNEAFTGSAQASTFIERAGPRGYWVDWVGWWTIRSFFGVFGYMDIWLNEAGLPAPQARDALYRLLLAATLVTFLAWLLTTAKGEWREASPVQVLNGLFLLVVVALFVRFNMQYFQAQGRYLLPAIGPIACGFALGTLKLSKGRGPVALAALAALLLGVNLYALGRLPGEFAKRVTQTIAVQ